jgi:hypothetical protein
MSDINLLPEDLKRKEDALKNRGDFSLDEIEFTEGKKLKKEKEITAKKLSGKNKLEKWLKPKVKVSLDFKKNYNKILDTNPIPENIPKIDNEQKEIEKKQEVLKPVDDFMKKEKQIIEKEKNKESYSFSSSNEFSKIEEDMNNKKIKPEEKVEEKKDPKFNKQKNKKNSNFFKKLFDKFSSNNQNEKANNKKKDEGLDVNLLPFGSNVPTTRRMISGLIITFILTSSLIFIVYFAYFIFKGKVVNDYSSLGNELDSYIEEIKKYDDLMRETSSWQEKITEIEYLLDKHIYWTKFFEKLEENTLPNVQFIGFAGNVNSSITLNAIAPNYQTISKQWIRLQGADDFVKKVEISSADMSKSKDSINISFSLTLDFVDGIFYKE